MPLSYLSGEDLPIESSRELTPLPPSARVVSLESPSRRIMIPQPWGE